MEPHSPDHLSPIQLSVSFDPDAKSPGIERFIEEVFPTDVVELGYEMPGLLSVPDTSWQKAFLLVGSGANGRTTYLNLIMDILGPENVSNISLHDLGSSKFLPAELYGKLANICADIPNQGLRSVAAFKSIVGGDRMIAERKYGQPFAFTPFARMIFAANEIPASPDSGYAYQRRWVPVRFPNQFKCDAADPNLLEKLTTADERSGFFNMALAAYLRLRKRGSFTAGESTREAAEEFKEAIDPVVSFITEKTLVAPEVQVDRAAFGDAYEEWCRKARRGSLARRTIYGRVLEEVPTIEEKKVKGRIVWVGIGLLGG